MSLERLGILFGILCGIIGAAVGILAFVQHKQAIKKAIEDKHAKELEEAQAKGAHDQREKEMKDQIDHAHRKIREDVMPKLAELERSHTEINTTFEYIKVSMEESKSMLKDMSRNIIELGQQVAGIQGERRAGKAKGVD